MGGREEFLQIWQQHITRPGSEKLLDWLDHKTDFFTAPASTRFHGACEGGLCMHSLNVYHALHDTFFTEGDSEETFAICALLHDLCKANYYKARHPQREKRSHRPVGKGAQLQRGGSVPLRPRRKERIPHRAVHETAHRGSRCHPLAHGRL